MEQNSELKIAWDFVENTGRSIFLTGKAGTGKTTFLKTVVHQSRKRPIVVAPTGVAAINAGGVTLHSVFQLPFSPYVPGAKVESKFDFGKEKRKIIASIDLLIIDEISMVRADLLDAIDSILRRYRDHYKPFGGVQLLMIGDLAQLTPVVTPEDEQLLSPYYDTPYFFGSKALQQIDYVTIQLDHVYRQQDDTFIEILNQIRTGRPTPQVLHQLNARYQPHFAPRADEPYIRLTTHNHIADSYNDAELRKLPGALHEYHAEIEGTFPDYSYPTAETLVLKEGAQVMFIKNDLSGEHRYYNGRIGRVVKAAGSQLSVYCEGDEGPIEVEPLEWENTRYTLNDDREIVSEVLGTFKQLPLRLAWAITIQKSQGLTFDRAIIDADQSFAPGQVYVALSRCRTLEGLVLAKPLSTRAIINDERVDNYIAGQEQEARRSIEQLPLLKQEYERHLLLALFDFQPLVAQQETMVRLFAEFFSRSYVELTRRHDQALLDLRSQVIAVAEKWQKQIQTMPYDNLHEPKFLERAKRGAKYFTDTLWNIFADLLTRTTQVEPGNKLAARRLNNALADERQLWVSRQYLLTKIAERGFNVSIYLKEKQHALLDAVDALDPKPKRRKTPKAQKREEVFDSISADRTEDVVLFDKLRKLRMKLALAEGLRPFHILSDKSLHELATLKPTTLAAFTLIYGIGETKRDKYGPQFLTVIKSHV